jgi:P4 family phage/plasmid primase-like protien
MESQVLEILKKCKSDNLFQTHVSLFPKGRFSIPRTKIDNFWNTFCNVLESNPDVKLGVAEKPQPYLPVLVDVDISRNLTISEDDTEEDIEKKLTEIYNETHVVKLIEIYQLTLKQILEDYESKDLYCILLQKEPYIKKKKNNEYILKHGFHLHFPYIFLNKVDQEVHLIPRIKDFLTKDKIFEDVGFSDSQSLIDTSYTSVPWLLYGCRKEENKDPYIATKMYNDFVKEISFEEGLRDYEIFDIDENIIKKKSTNRIEFYLPRILSIIPFGREVQSLKPTLPSFNKINKKKTKQNNINKQVNDDFFFSENIKKIKSLVNLLASSRAENYSEWMKVGWILYNIGDGCDDAFNIWLDFSKRSSKYDEDSCIKTWERMVTKNLTIGSLILYAETDSPVEYKKLKNQYINDHVEKSIIAGTHHDIAKCLYEEYGTRFVCASLRNKLWYEFRNNCWLEIEGGMGLRKKISKNVVQLFEDKKAKLSDLCREDENQRDICNARIKTILKVINSLKNASFKNNVMKECEELFYDGTFFNKLNKNPYLICFQNGVYDLRNHEFRDGTPDDYISLKMAVNYVQFDDGDLRLTQVNDFLIKVFPDKSVRDYFMDTSCNVFVGGNQSKVVQVWTGDGDNGKSITESIFEKMLGQYSVKLPTSLIIGKRTQSSAACPELVRAGNGVRFAVLQEPSQKDIINIGILKELSGNDTFFARGLFKDGGEITPMFKLILVCNEPPQLPYGDKAVWNRIRVIPFESCFVDPDDELPDTFEEQLAAKRFPKDKEFADKIPGMLEAFAYMLLEHKKHLKPNKTEPQKVKMATEGYRKKNDVYRQFVEEIIIEDSKSSISLVELYSLFKNWFKESMPNHSIPIKNDVYGYFLKAWGDVKTGVKWSGWRERTMQDDIKEGRSIVIDNQEELGEDEDEDFVPDL